MKNFSDDIGTLFALDQCAKGTVKRGKLTGTTSVERDQKTVVKALEQEEVCKYFGGDESNGIEPTTMKENIRKECYRRVRAVLKTELNSKNCIEAIITLAIPVVKYGFNIINWAIPEIRTVYTKIRKLLTLIGW